MLLSNRQKKITASILLIILAAFLSGSFNSIIVLWKSGYIEENQYISGFNSVELDVLNSIERSYKSIFPPSDTALEKIYLYISEKNQSHLLSDLPSSRKKWVDGLILEEGKLKKISVKHRGDNPNNWLHDKKSWRVKRKKSDLKNGVRVFNYSLPRDSSLINTYMGYFVANKMNIPAPKFKFVEIYINDKYEGLYLETQHIDENFLRMNKIMPVNIYKGTPSRTDKPFNQDVDLFNNPYLWEKNAIYNARDSSNYMDLERFLKLVRSSVNDIEEMKELEKVADIKKWANFSAYETIMQSWHNYEKNNMYLISDPWIGEFYPIAYDTIFNDTKPNVDIDEPINMDNAAHALMEVYTNNSKFLFEKYKILDELIKNNFYEDIEKEAKQIYSVIQDSWKNDPSHVQFALSNEFNRNLIFNTAMELEVENFIKRINFIEENIRNNLNSIKSFSWTQNNNDFELVINSYKPLNKIKICLKLNPGYKSIDLLDKNNNEFKGIEDKNGCYDFNIGINSNRFKLQNSASRITTFSASNGFNVTPTVFPFILDNNIEISNVYAMFLGSEDFVSPVKNESKEKNTRIINNSAINLYPVDDVITWQGDVYVDDLMVIENRLTILPGTNVFIGPNASIVFKKQVKSIGNEENKINFLKLEEGSWGVVALVGKETKGSIFKHTNINGGSGGNFNGYEFTGMLSLHLTEDIKFSDVSISNNSNFDDLVHVLYSNKIKFSDSIFSDALSDAIDIDISTVEIDNCIFNNSGNDSIDSMTSNLKVTNSFIDGAGDKGISAGESSEILVRNLTFNNTEIAIQSKDNTNVTVSNSKFFNNRIQLDAYQKNWRYGNGGKIIVSDSLFNGEKNQINAKNKSEIFVINSAFNSNFLHLKTKKVFLEGNYLNIQ